MGTTTPKNQYNKGTSQQIESHIKEKRVFVWIDIPNQSGNIKGNNI